MARSTVVRRTAGLAGAGLLAGLGLLAAAGPAAAAVGAAGIVPANVSVAAAHFGHSDWCPFGYWHHSGLPSGLLDGTGHLLRALL